MTSQLASLRRQLSRLGRARAAVRVTAALAALLSCLVAGLLTLWALDALLWLSRGQRLAALTLLAGLLAWAWRMYARSQILTRESLAEVALLVQRRYGIDTDLLAALQFEAADGRHCGSPRLAQAVIDQVAERSSRIDVFAGFSVRPAVHRLALAGILALTTLLLVWEFPEHARVFSQRLLLSSVPYPTRTHIVWVVIPPTTVRTPDKPHKTHPCVDIAEGHPVYFYVVCRGWLPMGGLVELKADGVSGGVASLPLVRLSLDERKALLEKALRHISADLDHSAGHTDKINGLPATTARQRAELQALVALDAPEAARAWMTAQGRDGLVDAKSVLEELLAHWPGQAGQQVVLAARLERLPADVEYRIFAGDAATEPGRLRIVPLPIVELELMATPPAYAALILPEQRSRQTQLAVLEGSRVALSVRCVNGKRLQGVWLVLGGSEADQAARRWPLVPARAAGDVWQLVGEASPLAAVRDDLRFRVEVVDHDGLTPAAPLGGFIRCLRDQPPGVWLSTIHRVVLPKATPAIQYRVTDDFGVAAVLLHVEVERRGGAVAGDGGPEVRTIQVYPLGPPVDAPLAGRVPTELRDAYRLPLDALGLHKGDRVKLVLEARDERGQNGPERELAAAASRSEPLVLEVSDESGVLAAIAEADEQAAQALSELIQQQRGIGETP